MEEHVIEIELKKLLEDRSNSRCADCGSTLEKQRNKIYISIKNGVFVCKSCGEIHKEMEAVKLIAEIKVKDIGYLDTGGNRRFHEFMQTYDLNIPDIRAKYKSKAAEYYRSQVKKMIMIVESYCRTPFIH